MGQRLTAFFLATAISTFCVANENNPIDLSGLSDEKIAAAREYYEASNQEGAMTDSKDSFIPMMTQIITQQTGFSPPTEFVAIFESALERSIDEFWIKSGAYLEFFIIINAEIFTTEELAELTAFYKTPLGIKFSKSMPKASVRMSEMMMPMMVKFQNQFPELIMQEAIAFCETNMDSDFCKVIAESA